MTSSIASVPATSLNVRSTGPANWYEIFKFARMTFIWLGIIFGAVWLVCWAVGVALPHYLPMLMGQGKVTDTVVELLKALVPLASVMVFIPINAMFMVLAERRALALFTVRKGPNRVGPDGLLQTAADAVKLLFKEDITPKGADAVMFTLAPIIFFAPSIFGAIPLLAAVTSNHPLFQVTSLPTGIFYVLAMSSIPVVALVMGGWASNNKYSLVGGLRAAAQAISYEIPLVLSLITICLIAGSLDIVTIVNQQAGGFWNWYILGGGAIPTAFLEVRSAGSIASALALAGCCILLFGIYLTGACAEINRIPFDLPEAESELVSGYNTEYSGIKFAIFFLAEFTNLFIVSTIATCLFLGGGASPIPGVLDADFFGGIFNAISTALPAGEIRWLFNSLLDPKTFAGAFWAIFKVYSLVIFAILVRGTLPRFRIDQLMDFGWKRLIPLTLILLLAVTYLMELVHHA
jgi:NADH-quinone oxidoreductase subunit H